VREGVVVKLEALDNRLPVKLANVDWAENDYRKSFG
jgi:hypothetical protein